MNRIPFPDFSKLPPDIEKFIQDDNLNLFKVWAHSTSSIKDVINLGADHYAGLELPPSIRELVILLTAHTIQSEYEWVQHASIAKTCGVTDAQIAAIQKLSVTEADFNTKELTALTLAKAVLSSPWVSDDVFGLAQSNFSNRELVEIVEVVGYYWMTGRIATVFTLDLDPPKPSEVSNSAQQFFKASHGAAG